MLHHLKSPRFIRFASFDAATNMAIDEAILDSHLEGLVPATLRLYGFAPPAVSIGHGQRIDAETLRSIESKGFTVVRRPTGGRAVLHFNDLTYSFICSSKHEANALVTEPGQRKLVLSTSENVGTEPRQGGAGSLSARRATSVLVSQSVSEAYRQICGGLICTLARFGLEVELGQSQSNYRHSQDCFQVTTGADLHVKGRKVIGSAQLRRKGAILQHGSLLLNQPQGLMSELLNKKAVKGAQLAEKGQPSRKPG